MNAAPAYDLLNVSQEPIASVSALVIPGELRALFEESEKMKASFLRLSERDRRGFVRYIDEPRSMLTRERRAAVVAMSLLGLARDLGDDGTVSDAGC